MNEEKLRSIGFKILRFGLAAIFIWFGTQQLLHTAAWTGFVPDWVTLSLISKAQFVMINGLFEVIAAILLVLNVWTRIVALLLSLHLFGIALSIGLNSQTGVRDFGLAISTLALACFGKGKDTQIM